MLGVVIVGHGHFAQELANVTAHVVGPQEQLEVVNIAPDDDMEAKRQEIAKAVEKVNSGYGVVLATDMFGGTPSNLAISMLDQAQVEIIAGVNLPLLVKLMSVRKTHTLHNAVLEAQEAGRKYIHAAAHLLNSQNENVAK